MGLKFRKRITVFPGFKINFSKSGISSTFGIKGLSFNLNKNGTYLNLGLPGSGIYDRIKISGNNKSNDLNNIFNHNDFNNDNIKLFENEIKSLDVGIMSDEIGEQIKNDIKESYKQKTELKKDVLIIKIKVFVLGICYFLLFGFLFKNYKNYFIESKELLNELLEIYENSGVNLDFNFNSESEKLFNELNDSFNNLINVKKVWDITSAKQNNGVHDRSGASTLLTRTLSGINIDELDFIKTSEKAFKFINKNGGDIFIYPGYVIIQSGPDLDIFDIRKLNINYYRSRFIEHENVCKDSKVLDYTWKYVNKSGTPDKRYSNNFQIPIVEYGNILFESDTGMCEEFLFSSSELLMDFGEKLENYISYISFGKVSSNESKNIDIKITNNNLQDREYINYNTLKCENGEILDTQRDKDFFNKLELEKEKVYDIYGKLSVEFEEIKQFGEYSKMIDFETKVHGYFSDEVLPKILDLGLIENIEPIKEKIVYDDRQFNNYEYIGKLINKKQFKEFKNILDNRLKYYKQGANEYLYDLYAKSLRRIGNYYKQNKLWVEALNIFNIIEDMGQAGIMDKKSIIRVKKETSKQRF